MAPRTEIVKTKLLVVEGVDALHFCISALDAYGVDDVQVMDFGGVRDLTAYLKSLSLFPGYDNVKTIVIARDAESDPVAAINSVRSSFKQTSLPVPQNPFEFTGATLKTAFMIFPGYEVQALTPGTLEDLCLDVVKDCSTFDCVNAYIQCLQSNGHEIKRPHKAKLHTYLSGKSDFVGLKIGEAAKAGAWDWDHLKLKPYRDIITAM